MGTRRNGSRFTSGRGLALLAWLVVVLVACSGQPAPTTMPTTTAPSPTATSSAQASPTRAPTTSPTQKPTPSPTLAATDPYSGLSWIDRADLPDEALDTLDLINAGGPFPYRSDGITFENREGVLPAKPKGYYHEFTVVTPGSEDRGARRIVTGEADEAYYTDDHYDSFSRIRLP